MNQVSQYLLAVVAGFAAGWLMHSVLSPTTAPVNRQLAQTAPAVSLSSGTDDSAEHADINPIAVEPVVETSTGETSAESSWTSLNFVAEVSSMSDSEYEQLIFEFGRNAGGLTQAQLLEVLKELHSISDSRTRFRLINLLGNSRFDGTNQADFLQYGLENWVMDQVRNFNQTEDWLDILSHWGIQNVEHVDFIVDSLAGYSEPARISAMLALSRNFTIDLPDTKIELTRLEDELQGYLDSDNELERAAALRALSPFSAEQISERLLGALDDQSEAVRLSALRVMIDRHRINTDAIKDLLVARMQSDSSSAMERVRSYTALQMLPIADEHYAAVYEFRRRHADRLTRQAQRENQNPYSPWM